MMQELQRIRAQLANTEDPIQKINLMNEAGWVSRNADVTYAIAISRTAYDLADSIGYQRGRALSLRNLTHASNSEGKYADALRYGLESVSAFEAIGDNSGVAQCLNLISQMHWELGNYSEAYEFTLRFLSLSREMGRRNLEADALNNLAMIHVNLEEYKRALDMLYQALPIFEEVGDERGRFFAYNNIAMMHFVAEEYDAALTQARMSLRIAEQPGFEAIKVKIYDTLGQIHTARNEPEDALHYLQQAESVAAEHDLARDQLYAAFNMGKIFLQAGQLSKAEPVLTRALTIADEIEANQARYESHQALASLYERRGDFQKALKHHKAYHQFNKEVFNEQSDRKLKGLEVRHRTESAIKEASLLRDKNRELEHEITERKKVEAALLEAKVAADAANQAKSEFLSNMSHELRTPLNGILGYTQILKRDASLSPRQSTAIDVIHQSGEHLLTLINDILDISKIEARKLELQPNDIHLPALLDGVVDIFRLRADQKGILFVYERSGQLPEGVHVDEKRLRQVLINLLGNAIKFTDQGQVIFNVFTDVAASKPESVRLRFEVIDSGIGIAQEDLKRIFQPLVQAGTPQSRAEGTGLGLAISQQLVSAMNGVIQVESEIGNGSRFWFDVDLPVAEVRQPDVVARTRPIIGYDGPRQTIMVVDDKAENRRILIDLLEPLGFTVRECVDGQQAVEAVDEFVPDLILMDLVMPKLDGFAAARAIRQKGFDRVPILAVSASVFDQAAEKSLVAGCDGFLPKPIQVDGLISALQTFLKLTWQFDVESQSTKDTVVDDNVMVPPPVSEVENLYQLSMMGDLISVAARVKELGRQDIRLQTFAKQAQRYAERYEEERLIQFLEEFREGSD